MPQSEMGKLLETYIRDTGPGATFDGALTWLKKNGLSCCQPTFHLYRRRIFPKGTPPVTPAPETNGKPAALPQGGSGTAPPSAYRLPDRPEPPADYLTKLLKFGMAVEAVGGIEAAERMLAVLRQLRETCR